MKEGQRVQIGSRSAIFMRVVTSKRSPWDAPTHAIVQFQHNIGTSKVKISDIKVLDTI